MRSIIPSSAVVEIFMAVFFMVFVFVLAITLRRGKLIQQQWLVFKSCL